MMVLRLSRDQQVHARGRRLGQGRCPGPGDHGCGHHVPGASGEDLCPVARRLPEAPRKVRQRDVGDALPSDRNSLVVAEGLETLKPELPRQDRRVAHLGVGVERQMHAVEGGIRLDQGLDAPEVAPGQGLQAIPEQPVMNDEQVGPAFRRFDDRPAGVNGRRDPPYRAGRVHLYPVESVRIVGEIGNSKVVVEESGDLRQSYGGHGRRLRATGR